MADRAKTRQSALTPTVACASTTRRQIAAGAGARLQALGPSTGADGAAALRPLRQPPRPPRPSPRSNSTCSATAAASPSTRMKNATRNARINVPPLAGVLQVDGRRIPRGRTCRATPDMVRTHCAHGYGTRARHAVSAHMSGGAQGWARRVWARRPGRGNGQSLPGSRPCPTSSWHASRARACERLRSAGASHMWATRVAQTRSGDQCRGCGQCVANVAHVAHAWVVRGGGANRVGRAEACPTRYIPTRVKRASVTALPRGGVPRSHGRPWTEGTGRLAN